MVDGTQKRWNVRGLWKWQWRRKPPEWQQQLAQIEQKAEDSQKGILKGKKDRTDYPTESWLDQEELYSSMENLRGELVLDMKMF